MKKFRTRRLRRTQRQALKHGPKAKSRHRAKTGRTGSIFEKKNHSTKHFPFSRTEGHAMTEDLRKAVEESREREKAVHDWNNPEHGNSTRCMRCNVSWRSRGKPCGFVVTSEPLFREELVKAHEEIARLTKLFQVTAVDLALAEKERDALKAEIESAPVVYRNGYFCDWSADGCRPKPDDSHRARLLRIEKIEAPK